MIVLHRFDLSRSRIGLSLSLMVAMLGGLGAGTGSVRAAPSPLSRADAAHPQILRPGDPHVHGLTDADLDALRAILRKAVDDRLVPGVSLLLAHKGEVIFKEAVGNLTLGHKALMASSSK